MASDKLKKRTRANSSTDNDGPHEDGSQLQLSEVELRVMEHFRRYLMSPGDMLCFSGQDLDSMRAGIDDLVERQMLVAENKAGGFSLTRHGFETMRSLSK